MATGRDILGGHIYDILSSSSPEIFTIGNTSNDAYMRFYDSNIPRNGVVMGLSNNGFIFYRDNTSNLNVGINTSRARTNLDIEGTTSLNKITTYHTSSNIYILENIVLSSNLIQNSSTYVGLGTTAPTKKLDVRGDVVFSDRLFHNNEEYRESQFRFLQGSNYTSNINNYTFSNIYYLNSVGIGTDSSNELTNYQLFVQGNSAFAGKVYASDFISYGGVAANSFLQIELYNSGNERLKTVITNDTNVTNRILYSVKTRPGRYLLFANIPYRNLSPYIFIDNQNWVEICLYRFKNPDTFTSDQDPFSLITMEVRTISPGISTQMIEFFVDSLADTDYIIAVRGKGHVLEFGSLETSGLQVIPIKGIGNDDSFTVRKALQPSPIRYTKVITAPTTDFDFSTAGRYTVEASNVDVFINGTKYIYESDLVKDYDITYSYNYTENRTTFNLTLTEPVLTEDVIHLAIWPYVTADTIFSSGYYYQNIVAYPSQWLNIFDGGIRYPKRVVIDGDLIVRGNFIGGCNTDLFTAGADVGSLSITCNVIGTYNIIDGAINTAKLGVNSIINEKIVDNSIYPTKLKMKNEILYVGCNYGEMDGGLLVNRRGIIVEGDIYITGQLSASNIAGSKESLADNSIETRKYKDNSVTFEKLAFNMIDNINLRNNIIATRNLRANCVISSNLLNQNVTFDKLAIASIYNSNIVEGTITSNEIGNFSITTEKLNLYRSNLGIGLSNQEALEKLHIIGNLLVDGNILSAQNNINNIGSSLKRFKDIYLGSTININNVKIEKNNYPTDAGINIINIISGNFAKCRVGNLITSNIGIGTDTPQSGLDLNYGNICIRDGSLGIGTTAPRFTIDALNTTGSGSTLMIGNIGIGTTSIYGNTTLSIYGGLFVNNQSNNVLYKDTITGSIGIGTTIAFSNLTIYNNDISINDSKLIINNGSITLNNSYDSTYTFNSTGLTKLEGNTNIIGNLLTCNIYTYTNTDIGTDSDPFNIVYSRQFNIKAPEGQINFKLYDNTISTINGDGYVSAATSISQIPLYINRNIVTGFMDAPNFFPYRNAIINGNMLIEQRYYGSNIFVNQNTSMMQSFYLDRHFTDIQNSTAVLNISKSNIFSANYFNSKVGIATSTIGVSSYHSILNHKIEGNIITKSLWGTSNAYPITLSFILKSDVVAKYYLSLHNHNKTRSIIREINVTQNLYPERYSYIINGDFYGDWKINNETGVWIQFNTGIGTNFLINESSSNQWLNTTHYGITGGNHTTYIGTTNTNLYLTNLQFEIGPFLTNYEYRPFSIELDLCKRYFEKSYPYELKLQTNTKEGMNMVFVSSTVNDTVAGTVPFKLSKRTSTWNGVWYSPTTEPGRLGIRSVSSPYNVAHAVGVNPTYYSTDGTLFAEKSQTNFSYHFNAPPQASRNYCFQWCVDAEL